MFRGLVALCLMTSIGLAQPSTERIVIASRDFLPFLPPEVTPDLVYDTADIDAAILSGLRALQQKPASRRVFVVILGGSERPSPLFAGVLAMVRAVSTVETYAITMSADSGEPMIPFVFRNARAVNSAAGFAAELARTMEPRPL